MDKATSDHHHEAVRLAELANGMCLLLNEGDKAAEAAAFVIADVLRERLNALADAMDSVHSRRDAAA